MAPERRRWRCTRTAPASRSSAADVRSCPSLDQDCYDRSMARRILCILVAGCSSAGTPGAAPAVRAPVQAHPERWIFRQFRVGTSPVATRTTFELVIDGGRVTLGELDEQAARARSVA